MAFYRVSSNSRARVGGLVRVFKDSQVHDFTDIPVMIGFDRKFDTEVPEFIYPALVDQAFTNLADNLSGCRATVLVGPNGGVNTFHGRWYMSVIIPSLGDGSAPVAAADAIDFY